MCDGVRSLQWAFDQVWQKTVSSFFHWWLWVAVAVLGAAPQTTGPPGYDLEAKIILLKVEKYILLYKIDRLFWKNKPAYIICFPFIMIFMIPMLADEENVPCGRRLRVRCWVCNQDKKYSRNTVNVIQSISANCLATPLQSLYSVWLRCVRWTMWWLLSGRVLLFLATLWDPSRPVLPWWGGLVPSAGTGAGGTGTGCGSRCRCHFCDRWYA